MSKEQIESVEDDNIMIDRVRAGDIEAFSPLVRKYEKRMYNIALSITGNTDDAEEAAQSAFVSAYKGISGFRGGSGFYTWLYRIVVNRTKDIVGQKGRLHISTDECMGLTDSRSPDPESIIEGKQLGHVIKICLRALDMLFREVVVLRDMEGLSYAEIEDVTGINAGTVKSRLHRARNLLRDCLRDKLGKELWNAVK